MRARRSRGRRASAWVKDEPFGVEFAEIEIAEGQMTARGVALGHEPVIYRLDYELTTTNDFVTAQLRATSRGEGWRRDLDLLRHDDGTWTAGAVEDGHIDLPSAGGDSALLARALDCDLAFSPVTNMMPILRHDLLYGGGPIDFTMAWVAVPALAVQPDRQRYRHIGSTAVHHVVRFEATDGSFAADITLDHDAVVIDYPAIARRLHDRQQPPSNSER